MEDEELIFEKNEIQRKIDLTNQKIKNKGRYVVYYLLVSFVWQ